MWEQFTTCFSHSCVCVWSRVRVSNKKLAFSIKPQIPYLVTIRWNYLGSTPLSSFVQLMPLFWSFSGRKEGKTTPTPNHSLSWIAIFSSEHRLKLWTPVELSTLTSTCKEILRWNNTPHSRLMDCSRTVAKGWERNASKISSVCFCKWNANEESFNETIGGEGLKTENS